MGDLREKVLDKANETSKILSERGYSVSIGIGSFIHSPEEFKPSFQGAWRAISIGKKLRRKGNIHDINSFSLEDLLLSLNKSAAQNTIRRNLDPLFGSPQWDSELEETLREWLNSPSHPGDVADRLGIHRNTLSYRLEKIRSLCGADLKDASNIFRLTLSLMLRDLHSPLPFDDAG